MSAPDQESIRQFLWGGKRVTAIDLGRSKYYEVRGTQFDNVELISGDILNLDLHNRQWDLIWASHVLEHQRNPGAFIDRLISLAKPNGFICITLPYPHRTLWGGHLTLWSPGLLVYHLALSGLDVSELQIITGNREFSAIFQNKINQNFPADLSFDSGDIDRLSAALPKWVAEASDPWKIF